MTKVSKRDSRRASPAIREDNLFALMLVGTVMMLPLAFGLAALLETPFPGEVRLEAVSITIGLIAIAPMAGLLWWVMRSALPAIVRFREQQITMFAEMGFRLSPLRIALIAAAAGVCEETLFRGVLQGYLTKHAPAIIAIVVPNILFAALHARSAIYALLAGVIGVWLGALYWATGNLLAPIIAHAVYDLIALVVTARLVEARQEETSLNNSSSVIG